MFTETRWCCLGDIFQPNKEHLYHDSHIHSQCIICFPSTKTWIMFLWFCSGISKLLLKARERWWALLNTEKDSMSLIYTRSVVAASTWPLLKLYETQPWKMLTKHFHKIYSLLQFSSIQVHFLGHKVAQRWVIFMSLDIFIHAIPDCMFLWTENIISHLRIVKPFDKLVDDVIRLFLFDIRKVPLLRSLLLFYYYQ